MYVKNKNTGAFEPYPMVANVTAAEIATTAKAGIVKPDDDTISVAADGTISANFMKIVKTDDDSTPPTDTSVLWIYPEEE